MSKECIGKHINELPTPCMLVYEKTLNENIIKMQKQSDELGVSLRPHIKTHKSTYVAKKQNEAGAIGVCCATIDECEAMAKGGIDNILLANEIVTDDKITRGLMLAKEREMHFAVDNMSVIRKFNDIAVELSVTANLLLDYDTGFKRCGIRSKEDALILANEINKLSNTSLKGIMTYDGTLNFIEDEKERLDDCNKSVQVFGDVIDYLQENDIELEIISFAGTGSYKELSKLKSATEFQCGSYVYSDNIYRKLNVDFENAMFILCTIIHKDKEHIVLDAGAKRIGTDKEGNIAVDKNINLISMKEEHYIAEIINGSEDNYKLGDKIIVIPAHCCTTNNKHRRFFLIDESEFVVDVVEIDG